jgi:hypothetical protein
MEFYQFSEELSRGPANHHHLPGQEPQSSTTERTQGSAWSPNNTQLDVLFIAAAVFFWKSISL